MSVKPVELLRRDPHITRLWTILIALVLFFAIVRTGPFLSGRTWQAMAVQFPEFGLMSLGVMLTMITAGIDLSVVGIANMTGITAATIMLSMTTNGSSPMAAITAGAVAALVMGTLAGALNGILVAKVRIPAILVTLGTLELFTGVAIIITAGRPISGLPVEYSQTMGGRLFDVIPMQLVVFVLSALGISFLLRKTTYGTKLYMLGTNPTAAKFSGMNSAWLLVKTYAISGLVSAIAGLVMLANYNSAKADRLRCGLYSANGADCGARWG